MGQDEGTLSIIKDLGWRIRRNHRIVPWLWSWISATRPIFAFAVGGPQERRPDSRQRNRHACPHCADALCKICASRENSAPRERATKKQFITGPCFSKFPPKSLSLHLTQNKSGIGGGSLPHS